MKNYLSLVLPVGVVLLFAVGLSAGDLNTKGKAWLDPHTEAPAINVAGNWHAKEWGKIVLRQAPDSREVTGDGDGWDISGVVSGKQVFLLFSNKGKVNYSAELTSQPDNSLNGTYARGFMSDGTKGKLIIMIKQ
jgi:hypothetical protein